ncbi:hypothetical protein SAMN05216462_2646 [Xylanibacter ruminicola]|uniref:Uncharacterized protein n=1 Tax=Xylanibacter ruminicola TaxID=839 RepID=A0A1H4E911_XYLRU|nr:hypothetical protein SAMN05216462_2646 [Xylanibacter ruminicola]
MFNNLDYYTFFIFYIKKINYNENSAERMSSRGRRR